MAQTFTDFMLRKVAPPASGRTELWDNRIPGFGIRISAGGTKTFILVYRHRGRPRRLTLGRYPFLTLAAAREKATAALASVALKQDPALAGQQTQDRTDYEFAKVVSAYMDIHYRPKNRPSTIKNTERILKSHFESAWGRRDVRDITQQHVFDVVDGIAKRGTGVEANHALTAIKTFFSWCIDRQILAVSPSARLKKPMRPTARSRVLMANEVRAVWAAFTALGYPFGTMGKLMLLTGQRRGEIAQMRREQIDTTNKTWLIPEQATKNARDHLLPLTDTVLSLLADVPLRPGDNRFFPARGNEETVASGFSRAKRRMDTLSGIEGWTYHDLRRTLSTGMAELGVAPHIIERVLNHASGELGGIAGVYNRFKYLPEMRAAFDKWDAHIASTCCRAEPHAR